MGPSKGFFSKSNEEKQALSEQELDVLEPAVRFAVDRETRIIVQAIHRRFPDVDLLDLPKTLREAYAELLLLEKPNLQDVAKYHAHFIVTNQIEHDHSSRSQVTRDFYRETAAKRGSDIFPDPKDARHANQFDDYLESAVSDLALARAHEQKEYLAFQEQVRTEIKHIQSLMQSSDELGSNLQEAKMSNGSKTMEFLNHTLDNMLRAEKKEGVEFYAKEVFSILTLLQSKCHDPDLSFEIEDSIRKLKGCVLNFKDHHLQLMHSLTDKRRDLKFGTMLSLLSVVAGSSVAHAGGLAILEEVGVVGSELLEIGASGASSSAKKALNKVASRIEKGTLQDDELLFNIMSVEPKKGLSDILANKRKELEEDPQKAMITISTMILCTAIGLVCPIAGAVVSSAMGLGETAKNFYYSQKALNYNEESADFRRVCHEIELQKYLTDYPEEDRILFVDQYQDRMQKLQNISDMKKEVAMDPESKDLLEAEMIPMKELPSSSGPK